MSLPRRLLELASRHVVLRRRLPSRYGGARLFVSPAASLKYWRLDLSSVDPMLLRFAAEHVRRDDSVWDIGANVGLFSFAAAGLGARVLSVEADTWLVALLRRSAAARNAAEGPVQILPAAAAADLGVAEFEIARRGRATNYLRDAAGSSQTGGVREVQLVPTVTLDWLAERFPPPAVLKVDVEGAEIAVLRGAGKLLRERPPVLLCEVAAQTSDGVTQILRGAGYSMYDAEAAAADRKPIDHAGRAGVPGRRNVLAYPPGARPAHGGAQDVGSSI